MNSIEVSAKTVEEALEEGIIKLGVKKENVQVEILSEPAQGLFKFLGAKTAKLRLTVIKDTEEYIRSFLENIMKLFHMK